MEMVEVWNGGAPSIGPGKAVKFGAPPAHKLASAPPKVREIFEAMKRG